MNDTQNKNHSQEILEAALNYAKRGWLVLPVWGITEKGSCECMKNCGNDAGKHPAGHLVSNWALNASNDEKKIREWFENKDYLNIGICTGDKSFIAVDVDWIDRDPNKGLPPHDDFAETLTIKTGSGAKQLWYAPEANLTNKQKIRSSVDIRANGGYVVAPPSKHKSGGYYEFTNNLPLSPFPENIKALLNNKPQINNEWDIKDNSFLFGQNPNDRHSALVKCTYWLGFLVKEKKITKEEGWDLCLARREQDKNFEEKTIDEWRKAYISAIEKQSLGSIKEKENLKQMLLDNVKSIAQYFKDPPIETKWIIKDLIPAIGIGSIVAREKSYKSYLSLYLACKIANGGMAFGKYEVLERHKVIVVDKENNVFLINERAKQILGGNEAENVLHISACRIPIFLDENGNGAKALLELAKEKQAKVIILDSLYHFNLGDESNAKDVSNIARQLIGLVNEGSGLVCIYLHHKAKNKDTFDSKGSVNLEAQVDFRLSIYKGTDENELPIIIFNEMYRRKKPANDWYVRIVGDENSIDFAYVGEWKADKGSKRGKEARFDDEEVKNKIYEILDSSDTPMMSSNNIFQELMNQNITRHKPRFLSLVTEMTRDDILGIKHEGQFMFYWIKRDQKSAEISVDKLF